MCKSLHKTWPQGKFLFVAFSKEKYRFAGKVLCWNHLNYSYLIYLTAYLSRLVRGKNLLVGMVTLLLWNTIFCLFGLSLIKSLICGQCTLVTKLFQNVSMSPWRSLQFKNGLEVYRRSIICMLLFPAAFVFPNNISILSLFDVRMLISIISTSIRNRMYVKYQFLACWRK